MTKRQKEVLKRSLQDEHAVLKELEKAYAEASRTIGEKIQQLLRRHPDMQSRIYQRRYQETIKKVIDQTLERLRSGEYKTLSDYLDSCYENGFLGTVYDMQGQGVPLVFPVDPDEMYRAVTLNSRLSSRLYTRLGYDVRQLKEAVRQEVSRGIASGWMISDIAAAINRKQAIGLNNAKRIARTEARRIQNEAAYDAALKAADAGADVLKEWCAILDSRTREDHRTLHGQRKELDEYFEVNGHRALHPSGFGVPNEDINCRCVLLTRARWAVEDEEETAKDTDAIVKKSEAKSFTRFKNEYRKIIDKPKAIVHLETTESCEEYFRLVSRKWSDGLSDFQMDAIFFYTRNSKPINDFLRTEKTSKTNKTAIKNIAISIAEAIETFELENSIQVYRGIDRDKLPFQDFSKINGEIYVEKGFASSSPVSDISIVNVHDTILEIHIPKGMGRGAYIRNQSFHPDEYEFLIQKGASFRILSAQEVGDKLHIEMVMIVSD